METVKVIAVPETEWQQMLNGQKEILELLHMLKNKSMANAPTVAYITAMEFMQAVQIGRTKFDQLVAQNRVQTIKKDRKIYVPIGEVERYFKV